MSEKIGKVNISASTGGLKLEGDDSWINPESDTVKKFIVARVKKGMEVRLELNDEGKITRTNILSGDTSKEESKTDNKVYSKNANGNGDMFLMSCMRTIGDVYRGTSVEPKNIAEMTEELYKRMKELR